MQLAVRSYLTTGVALVGAGAIAVGPISPIHPSSPHVQIPASAVSSPPVDLAALVNPIELWLEVLGTTAGNLGAIAETVLANPTPILSAIIRNQSITAGVYLELVTTFGETLLTGLGNVPAALQVAFGEILDGQIAQGVVDVVGAFLVPVIEAAFAVLGSPLFFDLQAVIQNPFLNAANAAVQVVGYPGLIGVGLPLLMESVAPIFQTAVAVQEIYDGIRAGDLVAVANAVISFPSDMVNTILNGSSDWIVGNYGLIGPNGLINGLLGLRQAIADALSPPPLASAALGAPTDPPQPQADSFMLNTSTDVEVTAEPAFAPAFAGSAEITLIERAGDDTEPGTTASDDIVTDDDRGSRTTRTAKRDRSGHGAAESTAGGEAGEKAGNEDKRTTASGKRTKAARSGGEAGEG